MQAFIDFFTQWGYLGLCFGSFIAGSVFPLSSEALVIACVGPLRLDPWLCLLAATIGNVVGGITCYWVGHLGELEWIEKYFHVKEDKLHRAIRMLQGRGAWMGILGWVPMLGTAIVVALGYLRANFPIVVMSMTIGKVLRYAVLIWSTIGIANLL